MTPNHYGVYGISLHSEIPLCLPHHADTPLAEIDIRTADDAWFIDATRQAEFQQAPSSWYRYAHLTDHSSYACWEDVGEFLVAADGKTIVCRQANQATAESFHVYLLGQALSFALVNQGFEPLHATTLAVDGEAIAFLGESGYGKSSLAACFLAAGHRILTDDLLIVHDGFAYPGPPRLKLFPAMARKFLGEASRGAPMNNATRKMIVPLGDRYIRTTRSPIRAIYALASPRNVFRKQTIRIESLPPRDAFLELVKNTFNCRITAADRLQRQFTEAAHLAASISVRRLSHPRDLRRLPAVRDAIISDLAGPQFPSQELAECAV